MPDRIKIRILQLDELLVTDAVRLVGFGAEAALAVRFVGFVVPLEVLDVRIAFEGKEVGGAMRSRTQRSWLMTTGTR